MDTVIACAAGSFRRRDTRPPKFPLGATVNHDRGNGPNGSLVGASGGFRVSNTKRSRIIRVNTSGTIGYCGTVEWRRCWKVALQYNRCLVSAVPVVGWNGPFTPSYAQSLAYVYCVRSFGVSRFASLPSHDRPACQGLVAELVPFLMDRSTLLLRSVSEARSSVQSRLNDKVAPPWLCEA